MSRPNFFNGIGQILSGAVTSFAQRPVAGAPTPRRKAGKVCTPCQANAMAQAARAQAQAFRGKR